MPSHFMLTSLPLHRPAIHEFWLLDFIYIRGKSEKATVAYSGGELTCMCVCVEYIKGNLRPLTLSQKKCDSISQNAWIIIK